MNSYCKCSAFDDIVKDGKVHEFQCVRDYGGSPCYYILMSEKYFYEEKSHKSEYKLRAFLWKIKHLLWKRKHKKCSLTECLKE
jgi:hypothetical protein